MSGATFGLFSPADGESFNPLLEELRQLRDHICCLAVVGFAMIEDPDRLFKVSEASVLTGFKSGTIRRWAARGRIASTWEAFGEYRLSAATIRQIRDEGPGGAGRFEPTFVAAPADEQARIRKLKRRADGEGGGDDAGA